MIKEETIIGYNNRKFKVYRNEVLDAKRLYVIYPGFNYDYHCPLFYYLTKLLEHNNESFIFFDLDWKLLSETSDLPYNEIYPHIENEIIKTFGLINTKKEKIIIGKSFGTIALELAKNHSINSSISKYIWLTPFTNTEKLPELTLNNDKDYIYVGDNDRFYSEDIYTQIKDISNLRKFNNLDHSFDLKENPLDSIDQLKEVIKQIYTDIM